MNRVERQLKKAFIWYTRELKKRNNWLCKREMPKEYKCEDFLKVEKQLIDLGIQPDYLTFVNELKTLNP